MFKDLAILSILDIAWVMGAGMYKPYIKSNLQPLAVALLWGVILAGEAALLQYNQTLTYAALLGFTIYFTFNATHMNLVRQDDWNWKIMGIDVAWGTFLFTVTRYLSNLL
jgi:uncharacterized membrane protein